MVNQNGSILDEIKKLLGLPSDYDVFDLDIILHINSSFSTLNQLGIGPPAGYSIQSSDETWSEFIEDNLKINSVKTYIFIKVKLAFDPPSASHAGDALLKQSQELEWRLNVSVEGEPKT